MKEHINGDSGDSVIMEIGDVGGFCDSYRALMNMFEKVLIAFAEKTGL
ncbi:hypothetical protein [Carnobacterium funditum]|nr:hypothetical protein [Carnobacterium funditum]